MTDQDTSQDGASPDHPNVPVPPPAVFAGAFVAGFLLQLIYDTSPGATAGGASDAIGGALIILGLGLGGWAILTFRKAGENPLPNTRTEAVLDRGPYRFSRNPMYVAMALVSFGIAFALSNAWMLLTTIIAMITVHVLVIRREEAYLQGKFGGAYTAYRERVRRWI